jgi:geranylgeranyl reductase family protein
MVEASSQKFDAIVVGAGPGGCSCAAHLSKAGRRVLLLDKEHFPRDKVCGDGISGKSISMLEELGLIDEIELTPHRNITGVTFSSPDGSVVEIPLPKKEEKISHGYCIQRKLFDNVLFRNAKQLSARTIEGLKIVDLIKDRDGDHEKVIGVIGMTREGQKEFYADIVVGADGANSTVARLVGNRQYDLEHLSTGLRCYYRGVGGLKENIELHFFDEFKPGYLWVFPLDDGYVNVGVAMVVGDMRSRKVNLKDALFRAIEENPVIKDRFKDSTMVPGTLKGGMMPLGSSRRKAHGCGWLLVGDAASLVDPFTGEGIGNALYSGKLAAEAISKAFKKNDFSEAQLSGYESALEEAFDQELINSYQMQKRAESRFLLNLFMRKASRSQEVRDLMVRTLTDSQSRVTYTSPLTYLKILITPPYW